MLAEVDGRPMLQHVLDLAAAAGLDPVVVVLGQDAEVIEAALTWGKEIRLINEDPARGISSSVEVALDAVGDSARTLILLGDQPRLTLDQLLAVLAADLDSARPIVIPRYRGIPGNPVVLERAAWPLARELEGDRGMSQRFHSHMDLIRYVDVPGRNPDVDTQADLEAVSRGGEGDRSGRKGDAGRHRP
jgi:molybdenum cofactor cytidylyltransferase